VTRDFTVRYADVFCLWWSSLDVSSNRHSRTVSKSSSSSSSSSLLYQPLPSPVAVTAVSAMSPSPGFPRHSQSTSADVRFHWSSSTAEHAERLSQLAPGDGRTSVEQVLFQRQTTPATGFTGSPDTGVNSVPQDSADIKYDSFFARDHHAPGDYSLACKDGVRSYVNLMTSGTVGGSGRFTNGYVINYVTDDARCSE